MGIRGDLPNVDNNFCFNAAKTWGNRWYAGSHADVDPSSRIYDGTLIGYQCSLERNHRIRIGCRKVGVKDGVPVHRDQVVIMEQSKELHRTSLWTAAVCKGETCTQSNRSSSGTLAIKVCSLETRSPGSARILVFASGQEMLNYDVNEMPAPTAPPVAGPSESGCQDKPGKSTWTNNQGKPCKFVARRETGVGFFVDVYLLFRSTSIQLSKARRLEITDAITLVELRMAFFKNC